MIGLSSIADPGSRAGSTTMPFGSFRRGKIHFSLAILLWQSKNIRLYFLAVRRVLCGLAILGSVYHSFSPQSQSGIIKEFLVSRSVAELPRP
jgi:hypothetical protein